MTTLWGSFILCYNGSYIENHSQIKLLSENKLIIYAFVNLHYQILREKFEPEPGLELGAQAWRSILVPLCSSGMLSQEEGLGVNWQLNQDSSMVERQARNQEVQIFLL